MLLLRFKMPRINGHAGINSDNVQVLYMKYICNILNLTKKEILEEGNHDSTSDQHFKRCLLRSD